MYALLAYFLHLWLALNYHFLHFPLNPKGIVNSDLYIREGPVSGNQEAAQIFIKYMYDIVLEISFLDINSQNWSNVGHMRLRQKSFKI